MVQRLVQLTIYRDDYACYPDGMLKPNGTYGSGHGNANRRQVDRVAGNGRPIQGLAQFYAATGYEPALPTLRRGEHSTYAIGAYAMLEYGLVTRDRSDLSDLPPSEQQFEVNQPNKC